MTIYASKTPRDMNHDPRPFRNKYDGSRWADPGVDIDGLTVVHDPSPEFDHVQHNEPNPILVKFRRHVAWQWAYLPEISTYAEDIETFDGLRPDSFVGVTPAQINHARKVLTRLANLSQIGS